ncbi:DnaJ domain-containing protein [Actinoallomurus sp. CA-142502]|uniref:DnaJ domain-containing protein n=1 Tax=Actinoallomurus sp. CA-142502 TaxID=3239885 RepID=UPI003D8EA85C
MADQHDYYAILGVASDATAEQIRIARRAKLRAAHPDANPGDPKAAERFDYICKICEVLGDPERRRMYDQELRGRTEGTARTRVRCRTCSGSGAWRFLKCDACGGLGRVRMGFARDCPECGGSGRVPDPCFRCDGRGWNTPSDPSPRPKPPKQPKPPPRAPVRNCYEVLGVASDADAEQITERYRQVVQIVGNQVTVPDEVKAAYRRIGDSRRRRGYDRGLGLVSSNGISEEIEVHVSRRVVVEGAGFHEFVVDDREICDSCQGAGRTVHRCETCGGRGYWQFGSSVPTKCDACGGKGGAESPCHGCALSGWVATTRTIAAPVAAGSDTETRITVRDELLGVSTLRLRVAPVPGFVRREE